MLGISWLMSSFRNASQTRALGSKPQSFMKSCGVGSLWRSTIETIFWNRDGLQRVTGVFLANQAEAVWSGVNIKRNLVGWGRVFSGAKAAAARMAPYQLAVKHYPTTGFKDSPYLQTEAA